jgi:hypothetical protein
MEDVVEDEGVFRTAGKTDQIGKQTQIQQDLNVRQAMGLIDPPRCIDLPLKPTIDRIKEAVVEDQEQVAQIEGQERKWDMQKEAGARDDQGKTGRGQPAQNDEPAYLSPEILLEYGCSRFSHNTAPPTDFLAGIS